MRICSRIPTNDPHTRPAIVNHRHLLVFFLLCAFLATAIFASDIAVAGTPPRRASSVSAPAPQGTYYAYLPLILTGNLESTRLWRFGVGKARGLLLDDTSSSIAALRYGWYTDFQASTSDLAPDYYALEYVPTVRLKQWKQGISSWQLYCLACAYVTPYTYTLVSPPSTSQLQALVATRPGKTWLIGNEIERRDWEDDNGQDEIVPELYAVAYHDIYAAIKAADPTAKVAIGGMVQATPLRLEYLDRVWSTYSQTYGVNMPVDVWNIHAFVLREARNDYGAEIPAGLSNSTGILYTVPDNKNFNHVKGHIVAFRTWMQQHGERNKPLYVSEYGVLYSTAVDSSFTDEAVKNDFMIPSFNYFRNQVDANLGYPADGNRLVQRWSWYSLDDDSMLSPGRPNFNGTLFYSGLSYPDGSGNPQGITTMGTHWRTYVQSLPIGYTKPYTP